MNVPDDRRYSEDHEWALAENGLVRVGITDFAQDALGDVVFVQLPDVGAKVTSGESMGEVESTKSVSDLYSPVTGTVVEVHSELVDNPSLLNDDPYGEGWICVIQPDGDTPIEGLLDADGYRKLTEM